MGKKSSPKAPDMTAVAAASEKQAELGYKASQEQLQWARDMWDKTEALLGPTLDIQQKIMNQNYENAIKDRAEYEQYKPLRDSLIKEFQEYDTPERRAKEAGDAQAQVRTANEAARQRSLDKLEGYGIDPSQTRSQALDKTLLTQQAANEAAAGNVARKATTDTGRALRSEAVNIASGMPSNVAQSYGMALNAGNSAISNMNSSVGTGAQTMGTGLQWGQYGTNATGQSANIRNSQFQNELASFEAQGSPMEMIATIGGIAAGAGYNEGGEVAPAMKAHPTQRTPTGHDAVPASLTPGEYIIPKEAVSFYGTKRLDGMVAQARKAQGIPENREEQRPPATRGAIPMPMNVGGSVIPIAGMDTDSMLAGQFMQNQGMATSAESFRTNQAIKREDERAASQASIKQAVGVGEAWKEGKQERAAKKAPAPAPAAPAPVAASPVTPKVSLESPTMSPSPAKAAADISDFLSK